ncbi:MAG: Uma2 family endonuclease [Phormidesmis sp.]
MPQVSQLYIAPGQSVQFRAVTWRQYKKVLEDLSPHRAIRLAYNNGKLIMMRSHAKQEDDKEIISDLIKALLEELSIDFRSFGSTTFERRSDLKAIEPDQCFYIQNEKAIRDKRQIDLKKDPAPDLAIEIDAEARSHPDIYAAFGVSELWQFNQTELSIHQLRAGRYQTVEESSHFPDLPIKDLLPYCLEQSRTLGRNVVIRDFRRWVRDTQQRLSEPSADVSI